MLFIFHVFYVFWNIIVSILLDFAMVSKYSTASARVDDGHKISYSGYTISARVYNGY